MRTRTCLLFCTQIILVTTAISNETQPPSRSAAAFQQLAKLAGEWEGMQDGQRISVTYTVTANGSALMEQDKPQQEPSAEMITMFTVDGDRLIATHYCSARNQPQMVSTTIGNLEKDGVTFSLDRVTGMKTPDDWHNTGLTITQQDADHITQHWTYRYKGTSGATTFHYARKK